MIPFGIRFNFSEQAVSTYSKKPFEELPGKSMSVFEAYPKLGSWDACIFCAYLESYVSSRKLGLGSRVVGSEMEILSHMGVVSCASPGPKPLNGQTKGSCVGSLLCLLTVQQFGSQNLAM